MTTVKYILLSRQHFWKISCHSRLSYMFILYSVRLTDCSTSITGWFWTVPLCGFLGHTGLKNGEVNERSDHQLTARPRKWHSMVRIEYERFCRKENTTENQLMAERHLKLLSDEFNFNKCFFTKSLLTKMLSETSASIFFFLDCPQFSYNNMIATKK